MKAKLIAYALFFLFITNNTEAQLECSNWHFGPTPKGLYFSPAAIPTVTNFSYTPYGAEGCSVLSDPTTGNLKFYTDGVNAIDAGHAVMPNGSGLLGLSSSEGSGKITQDPANCNRYYIFHNTSAFESGSSTKKLYYSIVDMSLPGNGTMAIPKGDVVSGSKNILVTSNVAEGMEIVPETNTHNFWLLTTSNSPSAISVFKFTASGITFINTYPLISSLVDMRPIVFCKTNNKIAVASMNDFDNTLLMDFNPATGVISSQSIIPGLPAGTNGNYYGIYALAWSQDGTKLYISKYRQGTTGGKLYQYNLTTSAVTLIYDVNPFSISFSARGLKMGPDGKIYFLYMATSGLVNYLGAVNNPNGAGLACSFNPTQISMGSDLMNANKFPDFLYSNNSILSISDMAISFNKPCNTSSDTTLIPVTLPSSDTDGDILSYQVIGNTFVGATAIFTGASTIQYINSAPLPLTDTLSILYCDNHCTSKCDTFNIILNITSSSVGSLSLPAILTSCINTPQLIDAGTGLYNYSWSNGDTTQTTIVLTGGMYTVTAQDSTGCIYSDSVSVVFNALPLIDLGNDTSVCGNLTLSVNPFTSINWNTGSTLQTITVTSSGVYYVNVTDSNGCEDDDTISVIINSPLTINIGGPFSFCDNTTINQVLFVSGASGSIWSTGSTNDSIIVNTAGTYSVIASSTTGCFSYDTTQIILLASPVSSLPIEYYGCPDNFNAGNAYSYLWSTSETTQSIYIQASGNYSVVLTNANGCSSTASMLASIENANANYLAKIPNVFTPNGDLQNDYFKINNIFNSCTKFRSITIYNRWGQKMFESEDPAFEWDGKHNGQDLSEGVYFGLLESGELEHIRTDSIFISIVR